MALQFEYSSDLFDAATIARYAGYYLNLLDDALNHPERKLSALRLIPPDERRQLLAWAGAPATPHIHTTPASLPAQIEHIPRQQAAAIALRHDGHSLSYGELDARANRLARQLVARGVQPDDAVVLCLERGFAMIESILAVLKAGACYVPVEPGLPAERLRYLINDSGARCLISHAASSERLRQLEGIEPASLLCLTQEADAIARRSAQPLHLPIHADRRAYIIYTSGSTGLPKGCELTHANVLRLFKACEAHFNFAPQDAPQVWSFFHSYAFDFSIWEIFGALLYGGRVVIVPSDTARSPSDFAELLAAEGVTLLSQTPSAFLRLLDHARAEADAQPESTELAEMAEIAEAASTAIAPWAQPLQNIVFGGEALEYASLRPWYRLGRDSLNPATRLINMYGITETTVHVTWREVSRAEVSPDVSLNDRPEMAGHSRSNIGRPLDDLTAYILDTHLEPQPVGVAGELYIGGAGLARGYLNRPELTAERFITHTFTPAAPPQRLYRTGDLARWTPRGEIDYLGRLDHQVKIHGYRIELGEIETRLASHPDITAALVLAVADKRTLQPRLVAWYCAGSTGSSTAINTSQLRAWLGQTLPEYMIPHSFVQLDALPLTANGKIDRARLQTDLSARPQLDVPYVAPTTPAEIRLAQVWREVLGVDQIGLQDNFFDLGGDSFSAYRLMARLSDELERDLPLEAIFRTQTIAAMLGELERTVAGETGGGAAAAALDAPGASAHVLAHQSSLVMIQAGQPGLPPFFCAHPAGGDVLGFQALAQALGADRPFYGIQSAGRLLGEARQPTLEMMCADYLLEIRQLQPHGPYLLGGHSMGGKVAYELARQIEAAGERVGVLAIFDADIVNKNTSMIDALMLLSETFRLNIARATLAALPQDKMMDYLLTAGKKRFARVLEIAYDMDLLPRGFRTRDAEMFLQRIATNIAVSDAYVAPPIHTPVTLFLATDHTENSYLIDVAAWQKVALGGVKVHAVAGNHLNLVQKPFVAAVAEVLRGVMVEGDGGMIG